MGRTLSVASLSLAVLWVWGGASACGSGGATAPPAPSLLQVGGQYQVAVALAENDCGSVEVTPQPTSVSHAPGSGDFSLTHGANTYAGHVAADGRFTTDVLRLGDADGSTLSVGIQGRFTTAGLEALVDVSVERPASRPPGQAPRCHYVVRWTGTKLGAPNVIP